MNDRFSATYLIETDIELADAAAVIAGEASTATFVKLTGAAAERVERLHAARVEPIAELDASDRPSLPVARPTQGRFRRAEVTISWPLANTGPSIPNILAAVAGNLSECREVTGLRLLDLDLPAALLGPYQGPQFGIAGTRKLAGVAGPAAHRHHHQAERRADPDRDRGSGRQPCRRRHRLHQGRRAHGRSAPLPLRRSGSRR